MSTLSRLLKNRYKKYYLDLAGINASVVRMIKPTIPTLEKKGELKDGWVRTYPNLNLEIDHNPCGYRLELRKIGDKTYSYRLRLTFKKDAPFFWSSPKRRQELTSLVNQEYKEHKRMFGFEHKTTIVTLLARFTTFVVEGEIKLD